MRERSRKPASCRVYCTRHGTGDDSDFCGTRQFVHLCSTGARLQAHRRCRVPHTRLQPPVAPADIDLLRLPTAQPVPCCIFVRAQHAWIPASAMSSSVQYERVATGEAADGAAAEADPPPRSEASSGTPQAAPKGFDGPVGPNQARSGWSPCALWQRLMFSWVAPLLHHGAKHKLVASNYPPLPRRMRVQSTHGRLAAAWSDEVARNRPSGPNLWIVMLRLYWWPFVVMGLAQVRHNSGCVCGRPRPRCTQVHAVRTLCVC